MNALKLSSPSLVSSSSSMDLFLQPFLARPDLSPQLFNLVYLSRALTDAAAAITYRRSYQGLLVPS